MHLTWLLLILLVACKKAPSEVLPADAAPAAPTADLVGAWLDAGSFHALAADPLTEVVVDDAGREPRRLLRYAPAPLDRRQYKLSVVTDQTIRTSGSPEASVAHVEHALWITLTAPEQAGMRWRYELGRIEVPEQGAMTGLLREKFADWQPARGELGIDERGRRAPDQRSLFAWRSLEANELMRLHEDLLDALLPVLPETAVGVGASWRIDDQLVRGSVTLARKARFELVGSPARPRLKVAIELIGGPQEATAMLPSQLIAYPLASWKVVLGSEYDWDGRGLLPDRAQVACHIDFGVLDPRPLPGREEPEVRYSRVELSASLSR